MIATTLTEQDIIRLKVILMDQDKDDAFAFIHERMMPEIERQEGKTMKSHLDGGRGSMF